MKLLSVKTIKKCSQEEGGVEEVESEMVSLGKPQYKTSQELGNCPMGQSEPLLKEKLYWKKGSIERKALLKERVNWNKFQNLAKFQNLVQVLKFGWNSEIWPNI